MRNCLPVSPQHKTEGHSDTKIKNLRPNEECLFFMHNKTSTHSYWKIFFQSPGTWIDMEIVQLLILGIIQSHHNGANKLWKGY